MDPDHADREAAKHAGPAHAPGPPPHSPPALIRTAGYFFVLYGIALVSGCLLSMWATYQCLRPSRDDGAGSICARQLDHVWSYQMTTPTALLNFFAGAGLAASSMRGQKSEKEPPP